MASIRLSGQPAAKRRVDQRIDGALLSEHTADEIAEECGLRRQILVALDLRPYPMFFELDQSRMKIGAGNVHLIQRPALAASRAAPRRLAFRSSGFDAIAINASLLLRFA